MLGRPGTVMLRSTFGNVLIRGGGTVLGTHRRSTQGPAFAVSGEIAAPSTSRPATAAWQIRSANTRSSRNVPAMPSNARVTTPSSATGAYPSA
jgi:hypothetical protein